MHLQLLNILLSQDLAGSLRARIAEYLFNHRLFQLLRVAIQRLVCHLP